MGLQAAVHMGHMPWALTKEEEEEIWLKYTHALKILAKFNI
jgi:hypothetical protein